MPISSAQSDRARRRHAMHTVIPMLALAVLLSASPYPKIRPSVAALGKPPNVRRVIGSRRQSRWSKGVMCRGADGGCRPMPRSLFETFGTRRVGLAPTTHAARPSEYATPVEFPLPHLMLGYHRSEPNLFRQCTESGRTPTRLTHSFGLSPILFAGLPT